MYREMRTALCDFDSAGTPAAGCGATPRQRAFYAALRSVLGQVGCTCGQTAHCICTVCS